jgi:AAA family ATP:ADP antiporter
MYELKKVLPMSMIFFFILFNYTCLRNIKDSLVVTGKGSGAEALPFLKLFCVTPSAILFMILYAKASNMFSKENIFYVTLIPFILFFGAFGFFLYPNKALLHPSIEFIADLQSAYPRFRWFFAIYGNWTYSVFYILAEIWGSAILSLSFWQFANQITRIPEAKRFYAFFGLLAQVALMLSGWFGNYCSNIKDKVAVGVDPWQISLYLLTGTVVIFGVATMLIYRWMHVSVLTDKRFYDESEKTGKTKKNKPKVSLMDSFKIILSSPYLGLIAMLVITYGVSVNFIEAFWKSQIGQKYPDPNAYSTFVNEVTFYTGIAAMFMMIIGGNILRIFSWFTAAVITPVVMLLMGGLFFTFVLFRDQLGPMIQKYGTDPVTVAIMLGAVVIMVTKATKYALFDLTKEMAYIPLDDDMKIKGKAVVDVVGGRLGKSGGAGFQTLLLLTLSIPKPTFNDIQSYVAIAFFIICILWILAVAALSKKVDKATAEQEKARKLAA